MMARPTSNYSRLDSFKPGCSVHQMDWRQSILRQLQLRKSTEQTPFEEICEFASNMFDKVDIYKSENIQLNLQREQLQQQLLNIQQTILAGGSNAAKTILSKLSNVNLNDDGSDPLGSTAAKNLNIKNASLLVEKSQLEKKLIDLQEKIADALKSKSDTVQKLVDLKTELDEKDRLNRQLTTTLDQKEREIAELSDHLQKLDSRHKTLTDEYLALTLSYKSLEKRHHALKIECDAMSIQILAVKREDAERLNAENDRIVKLQQDRLRKELETNVNDMTQAHLSKQAAGDPNAIAVAAIATDSFEGIDLDDDLRSFNAPSKIPNDIECFFEAHDGESCALNWFTFGGPKEDYLATGGSDRKVKIWKVTDQTCTATLLGSNASITSIDVESEAILASSNDYATRVWSLAPIHKLSRTLTGHSAKVLSAKFLGVPNKVASGSQDRTVKIWDITQGACFRTYFAGSSCYDLVYSNYQVITGHFDSKIRFWDLRRPNDNESSGQIALQSKITSLDVSRDGFKLLCSLRDTTIKCLDLRRMEVLQTYSDEKFRIGSDVCRAKFSIDGQLISCGSHDGSLYIWDANSAKVEKILHGHNSAVLASCWSPDGKRMASIERGKKVSIWI